MKRSDMVKDIVKVLDSFLNGYGRSDSFLNLISEEILEKIEANGMSPHMDWDKDCDK